MSTKLSRRKPRKVAPKVRSFTKKPDQLKKRPKKARVYGRLENTALDLLRQVYPILILNSDEDSRKVADDVRKCIRSDMGIFNYLEWLEKGMPLDWDGAVY